MYRRPMFHVLLTRLQERRRFLQVLSGPGDSRQDHSGSAVLSACPIRRITRPRCPEPPERAWIEQQWGVARLLCREGKERRTVLVLDEIRRSWSGPKW